MQVKHVLASDINDTLTGDPGALQRLAQQLAALRESGQLFLVLSTGRRLDQVIEGRHGECCGDEIHTGLVSVDADSASHFEATLFQAHDAFGPFVVPGDILEFDPLSDEWVPQDEEALMVAVQHDFSNGELVDINVPFFQFIGGVSVEEILSEISIAAFAETAFSVEGGPCQVVL